jgi:amidohydrolase
VRFVFQPAEETDGGGRHMCEQGALDDPSVAAIFALHGWPSMAVGEIGLRAGPAMAASNPFTIRVRGKGGHAAYPQRSIDPILVSARIIDGLQTIASRTATPGDPVVVTVARIQAGTIGNVIPDEAEMEGTIRTVNPSTRELVTESVRRIAERTAEAFGASAEVNLVEGYPSLLNDPGLTDYVATVAGDVFGLDNVSTDLPISMGVEDFAYYAQRVPAVMFRLGLKQPADESFPGLHTSTFDFNDDALPVGIRLFVELALRWNEEAPR